jgi:hypothetical protein
MRKIFKIFLALLLISLFLPVIPVQGAGGNAIMRLTSVKTTYYAGETVYVDIQVEPNGEILNTVRAIMDFTGGDVLLLDDFSLGDAFPYQSPGKELNNVTNHINVGGFILVETVTANSLLGTLIFKANQVGSSTITFSSGSHLISPDQVEKINLTGCQPITINVIAPPPLPPPPNHAPIFAPVANKSILLGDAVNFEVLATDPDNDNVTLTWDIPADASIINITTGPTAKGDFLWTPSGKGTYTLYFYAQDDHATDPKSATLAVQVSVSVPIPVPVVNNPPVFQHVNNFSIILGSPVNFIVRATDPDNDLVTLSWDIPAGASFTDVTSDITATGNFSWLPTAVGVYTVNFTATDNNLEMPKSANMSVSIGVSILPPLPNHAPIFDPVEEKVVNAGETLTFDVRATDPDGDNVALSMQPLETANFSVLSTGSSSTGRFSWAPTTSGIYFVLFDALDDHPTNPLSKSLAVRITVFGGQCPPCGGTCPILTCEEILPEEILTDKLAPIISSPSHPDQAQWYSNNQPQFTWEVEEEGQGYVFNLDQNPEAEPRGSYYFSQDKFFAFRNIADGFWYFHLSVKYADGYGPTAHYRVKIDTIAPEFFKPNIEQDQTAGTAKIYFSALDKYSGVAYYEMKIDRGSWQKVESPYLVTEADRNSQTMFLRAVDNAGNAVETSIDLKNLIVSEEEKKYVIEEKVVPPVTPPIEKERPSEVITKSLLERLTDLWNSLFGAQFQGFAQNILTPALLGVALLNTLPETLPIALSFLPYLHLLFTEPLLWLFKRHKEKWGVVYNSLSKKPLGLSIVRLYNRANKQLVQTKISDPEGRYLFLAKEMGRYYLEVTKPDFIFPSKYVINLKDDGKYLDIYHGEEIEITKKKSEISRNIPMDPVDKVLLPQKVLIRAYIFKLCRSVVSYLGIILALFTVIIIPTKLTITALIIHIILFIIFHTLILPRRPKSWGTIYDKKTRAGLARAIVRIFDLRYNKLLETQVSDFKGRYSFLVGQNEYSLTAQKQGYETRTIKPVDMLKRERIVNMNIALTKLQIAIGPAVNLENSPAEGDIIKQDINPKDQNVKNN